MREKRKKVTKFSKFFVTFDIFFPFCGKHENSAQLPNSSSLLPLFCFLFVAPLEHHFLSHFTPSQKKTLGCFVLRFGFVCPDFIMVKRFKREERERDGRSDGERG